MPSDFKMLKLHQLDQQLQIWRAATVKAPAPKEGWLRTVRRSIGLSTGQLARRLGVRQPWVMQLEKGEARGTVTLASLRKAAQALDCDLVYALVPRVPLEKRVRAQASRVAARELKSVSHSMDLERQRPGRDVERRQLQALQTRLLAGPWRMLWR